MPSRAKWAFYVIQTGIILEFLWKSNIRWFFPLHIMHKERLAEQIKHAKAMARSVVKWTLQFSTYCMQTGNSSCTGWAAAFPRGAHSSVGKESACNAGDPGSIPGSGRSPGEGKGYPLQYSGLENSMDCIVHGVTKSQQQGQILLHSLGSGYFSLFSVPWTSPAHAHPTALAPVCLQRTFCPWIFTGWVPSHHSALRSKVTP